MTDFLSTRAFIRCDNLQIAGKNWPSNYNDNSYLKFSVADGITWHPATDSLNNTDGGLNDYIIMNQNKGGSGVTLVPNTSSYIRAGPGERTGGVDSKGTGLTYTPRGQITLGLTHEDHDDASTDISIHGSSLTQHFSATHKEISIIGDKVKLQYPSSGEKLFQESPLSFKVSGGGIFKRENNAWINENYKSDLMSNKTFGNPHILGELCFPKGKSNVVYGQGSGNRGVSSERKELDGIFKNHKVIDENLSSTENEYKNWTIETTVNDKKESNIIEEYNVGYQKIYGKFDNYNNPVNGENTFKYNDYYNGWNLSVSAYTKYTTSNPSTYTIRPGTVFKIVKGSPSVTHYETLTHVCNGADTTLFFENSYENYDGGTIYIDGIAASTTVNDGGSLPSSTITLSNPTTSFIPAQTIVTFTSNGVDTDGIIQNAVEAGATSITLILACPDPVDNDLSIVIKPFNTSAITLTKVNYSEKIVNYTIKKGALPANTKANTTINNITEATVLIDISEPGGGGGATDTIPVGTTLQIEGYGEHIFKVITEVAIGGISIPVQYIGIGVFIIDTSENIYIKSFTGDTLIVNDDFRTWELSKNNTLKTLSLQDVDSKFYISTQNKEHEKGIVYGDRIGKMIDNRKLGIYHREELGFYIGWNIYLWNTKIPLNNSLVSDILATTVIIFTNPLDSSDTLEVSLVEDALTTSPNILTLPNDTGKNLDGYKVTIKGFPSGTIITYRPSIMNNIFNLSRELDGVLPNNSRILLTSPDGNTKYYYSVIGIVGPGVPRINLYPQGVAANNPVLPVDTDLIGYTVEIMGIPDNTTVDLPSGIIEGYNSRLNTIQVLLNNRSYTVDNNTFYCLKKGYKTSNLVDPDDYFVNLDGNKILNDGYYNNWKIEVESEKNKGYYESSSDYIISDYKKRKLITNYDANYSGVLVDSSTLPMTKKPVEADYFKGCRIVVSSESGVQNSTTNYKGIITSHGASTADTSKIVTGTVIEGVVDNLGKSTLTIRPGLAAEIILGTKILVTSSSGTTSIVEVGLPANAAATELTLTTILSGVEGGSVFMLTDLINLVVQWDDPSPPGPTIDNFIITYNNENWGDTRQRTLMYKTLKAEHISSDSNENNTNRLTGFLKLENPPDINAPNAPSMETNRVELLSNAVDANILTDFSPPSSEYNYYKGWKITLKFTDNEQSFNIINYSGTTHEATLDGLLTVSLVAGQGNYVSSFVLTKNLIHQEVIDDIFNIDTVVTHSNFDIAPNTPTLTINNPTKTTSIDDFRIVLLSPPRVFKSHTTINSMTMVSLTTTTSDVTEGTTVINISPSTVIIPVGTNIDVGGKVFVVATEVQIGISTIIVSHTFVTAFTLPIGTSITILSYITIGLNSEMDSSIGMGVGIELISKDNTYKTTVFEASDDANMSELKIVYTTEINTIIDDNTKDNYIINVSGKSTRSPISSLTATTIILETKPIYNNVIGWYVSLYNDRKYKIFYDNFSGTADSRVDSGVGFDLWSSLSGVNDFYKNWTLQLEEYFDQIDMVEDNFTKRSTLTIDEFTGLNKTVTHPPPGYTFSVRDPTFSKLSANLIPSKNIKFGDNINNPTTNSYKLISNYKTDKNKLIERGVMQKENTLSTLSSGLNDYYSGWEITTYNTITSKNDKLILVYNSVTEKVIDIKHGSYSGTELALELKLKLNAAVGATHFTVSFSASTQKIMFSAPDTFSFKWNKTHEHYLTTLHETLGFEKTDNPTNLTVTSTNKISLYLSENGESSIIEKYDGVTKSFTFSSLRSNGSLSSIGSITNNRTQYILSPPEHISGKLTINGVNNITINKDYSIGNNDFYNGWDIITYTDGSYQSSHITDYDQITKKITTPSLDISTLSGGNTSYFLRNEKHLSGNLRKNTKTVFPSGDKKGVLRVDQITKYEYSSGSPVDPTGIEIHLYDDPSISGNFKWVGLPEPSTTEDYYNNWKISIYINNIEYHSTIRKYYSDGYRIILDDINSEIFIETETDTVYKYILYEPSYYMLSFDALPVNDYYNGWLINVSNNNEYHTSLISGYQGKGRKIIADSLPEKLDESYRYELIENNEGVMTSQLTLSNDASEIKEYYQGWTLATIDVDGNIYKTAKITSYDSVSKIITLDDNTIITDDTTRYKLYFNSDNSIFGKSSGKNIYTGSRNIVIGTNAGPINTDNGLSDRLYIDSDTNTRGIDSFIYGNMTRGSEELKVNADIRIPNDQRIYGDITSNGTSSFTTVNVSDNLTVNGNLVINGTNTEINTTSLVVTDALIKLGNGNGVNGPHDAIDIGIYAQYKKTDTINFSGIFRDHSDEKWKLFKDLTSEPGAGDDFNFLPDGDMIVGTLVANIEGDFIGFYDDVAAPNMIKLEAPPMLDAAGSTVKNLILPNVATGSTLISSGDTGTVSSNMLTDTLSGTHPTNGAGIYGSETEIPELVIDAQGRITGVSLKSISTDLLVGADSGSSTINSSETLTLTGGNGIITTVGTNVVTFDLADTLVGTTFQDNAPGQYGSTTDIPVITIDAQGRITAAGVATIPAPATDMVTFEGAQHLKNKTFGGDSPIKFRGENKEADTTLAAGTNWKINAPRATTGAPADTNIQVVDESSGMPTGMLGTNNTFMGYGIASSSITDPSGTGNSIFGSMAGNNITTGDQNTFIGTQAGYNNITGEDNTLIGRAAGYNVTGGEFNTMVGMAAGDMVTSGGHNTLIGGNAGNTLTGNGNICLGYNAGPSSNTTMDYRVYIDARNFSWTATEGAGSESLIYGDQSSASLQTLSLNAAVTISNVSGAGTLDVQGGTINFAGENKAADVANGTNWKINAPSAISAATTDTNIQVVDEGSGMPTGMSATNNTFMGYGICASSASLGAAYPSGGDNSIFGSMAGNHLTTGNYNTLIGKHTAYDMTTGANNSVLGRDAGYALRVGGRNTVIGNESGKYMMDGNENVCLGYRAGQGWSNAQTNVTGGRNTYLGAYAGTSFGNGLDNIAIGYNTGKNLTLGSLSNRLYIDAGSTGFVGTSNPAASILATDSSGGAKGENSLIYGDQSSSSLQTLSFNAAVTISNVSGAGTLDVQGGTINFAGENKAAGQAAGKNWKINAPSLSDGTGGDPDRNIQVVDVGHGLPTGTPATYNTFMGYGIGAAAGPNGDGNSIFGGEAGNSLTTGENNTFIGFRAGYQNTIGVRNTLIGRLAGYNVSVGEDNVMVGNSAGSLITTGSHNTMIGDRAGTSLQAGSSNNICIGFYTGPNATNDTSPGGGAAAPVEVSQRVYIDANTAEVTAGEASLIYGDQSSATESSLSINALINLKHSKANYSEGMLRFWDRFGAGFVAVRGPPTSIPSGGSYYITLPAAPPTVANSVLKSTTGGLLSWGSSSLDPAPPELNKVLVGTGSAAGDWGMREFSAVCFLPGTKITLFNNIKINIEKLQKGDKLLSYKLDDMVPYTKLVDVLSWFSEEDTGEFSESEVSNIWSDKSLGYIILNDKLHVTYEHLIFTKVDEEYTWLSAKEIRKGDIVFTDKGEYEEITKIEKIKEEVTVYNLRVKSSAMNYFADSYLVHNASLCDECAAKNKL